MIFSQAKLRIFLSIYFIAIFGFLNPDNINLASAATINDTSSQNNSIQRILNEILNNNLSLKSVAASNEAEELELLSANTLGPTSIEFSPFFHSGVTGLASSELIVKQEFDFPTQYAERAKSASLKRRALDGIIAEQCRSITIEATQACIDLISLDLERNVLEQRLATTDSLIKLYERKLQIRSATLLEVNKIKLSRQDIARELLENEIASKEIQAQIIVLNSGKTPNFSDLSYPCPLSEVRIPESVEAYVRGLPSMATTQAEIASSIQDIKIADKSWLPGFNVGYRMNTETGQVSNGFLIGIDFPIFGRGKRIKAAQAKKAAAEMQFMTNQASAEAEATTTISRLKLIKSTLDAYDLNLIESTISLYQKSLKAGQITLTDYYQETDLLYDRLINRIRLEHDYRRLAASLMPCI